MPPGQPRVRGEHAAALVRVRDQDGSAPRARGTRRVVEFVVVGDRVSPACAGNTPNGSGRCRNPPGQPRVRGEHDREIVGDDEVSGSAPRARGTQITTAATLSLKRVSPACAGNTGKTLTPQVRMTGQPRVRGEHIGPGAWSSCIAGSAPRARGTQRHRRRRHGGRRVSPACAGNTRARIGNPRTRPGQPRVRGEHTDATGVLGDLYGSAPRARGTLFSKATDSKRFFC